MNLLDGLFQIWYDMNMNMNTKPTKQFQARQGDVLIEETTETPEGASQAGRAILSYGESTGHVHAVEGVESWKVGDNITAIRVSQPQPVCHPKHGPIPLTAGRYKITQQRQYTPAGIRRVAD